MTAPYCTEGGITLYVGDCLEVLPTLPAESVDAIVTDPPYGLKFMGKQWDHGVPGVPFWEAVLRVAKPGAHLLAFGGTRTSHRLVCAIEDAGWEIRDTLMWVYGSGFPKSLDVSKAIDKERDDNADGLRVGAWLKAQREAKGFKQKDVAALWPSITGGLTGCVANWETIGKVPKWDQWLTLKAFIGFGDEMDAEVWRLNGRKGTPGEAWDKRPVLGKAEVPIGHAFAGPTYGGDSSSHTVPVTAPATDAAKQWDGWGTALKPAVEPIVLARKPLIGTVAANVQRYGTGALNIDASRIGTDGGNRRGDLSTTAPRGASMGAYAVPASPIDGLGRWPANLIHDGSPEVVECFPESESTGRPAGTYKGMGYHGAGPWPMPAIEASSGNASRFFYVAKASKADRYSEAGNDHPTVKPVALIQYLIRLITPPGGVVLDPFSGSGTTPKAARDLGIKCIAIDLEERHQEIAKHRLNQGVLDFGAA